MRVQLIFRDQLGFLLWHTQFDKSYRQKMSTILILSILKKVSNTVNVGYFLGLFFIFLIQNSIILIILYLIFQKSHFLSFSELYNSGNNNISFELRKLNWKKTFKITIKWSRDKNSKWGKLSYKKYPYIRILKRERKL